MPANRMNRDEFYAAMAPHDDARLRKILWTVYWRGNAQLRERIEDELRLRTGEPVVEAYLDYVDGGRQVGIDPDVVRSETFRALLRGLVDAIGRGVFVQEPSSCDWCDFTAVCGPKGLLERRRRIKLGDKRIQEVLRLRDIS